MDMSDPRIGRFDSRIHPTSHVIEPYGRLSLGHGISTVTLVSCDAVAMQLVSEHNDVRINEGATLALNGVQRFIRNPWSRPVKFSILEDLPVQTRPPQDVATGEKHNFHGMHICALEAASGGQNKAGLVVMAKRGDLHFVLRCHGTTEVYRLADAKVEYADVPIQEGFMNQIPLAYDAAGEAVENIVARSGYYTDANIAAWAAETGWALEPAKISEDNAYAIGGLAEGSALFISSPEDQLLKSNLALFDLGDWNPQWKG
ncbi:MAG: hypothetical protein AAF429_14470 [Pseudomonadota bacterium]